MVSNSDLFIALFSPAVIGCSNHFGNVFLQVIWRLLYYPLLGYEDKNQRIYVYCELKNPRLRQQQEHLKTSYLKCN